MVALSRSGSLKMGFQDPVDTSRPASEHTEPLNTMIINRHRFLDRLRLGPRGHAIEGDVSMQLILCYHTGNTPPCLRGEGEGRWLLCTCTVPRVRVSRWCNMASKPMGRSATGAISVTVRAPFSSYNTLTKGACPRSNSRSST